MNKHIKLAFMVAPILAIVGFIAADYYKESEASKDKVVALITQGNCDIANKNCVLVSGDFKINVSDSAGVTEINSTFPLDSATLFLVDKSNRMTPYPLGMKKSPYYWRSNTPLSSLLANKGDNYKLRLIAKIKGGQYISEFSSETVK